MEIIGMVFYNSSKWDIIKIDNTLYCGECLFVYRDFNQVLEHVKITKLDDLPHECIIKFYDFRFYR